MYQIIRANMKHLDEAARLFNAYRTFYRQPDDLPTARRFIETRMRNDESLVLLATLTERPQQAIGFVQVYKSFSSVQARPLYTLNDLFVEEPYRKHGVARRLMQEVHRLAISNGVASIQLETAPDNTAARQLYEKLGYQNTPSSYLSYSLTLPLPDIDAMPVAKVNRGNRKLVMITGVTSGLGRVMLERFDEQNWCIAGCGRSETDVAALQMQFGDKHHFESVDVSKEAAVQNWVRHVQEACGSVDLLINNASIINQSASTWDVPLNEFRTVIDINVMGTVNVLHHCKPILSEEAVIVNVSSSWGRQGDVNVGPYCASKFAVEGLSRSMAKEMTEAKSNQTLVTLDPGGGIATSMLSICSPDYMSEAPTPEEWSRVAVPYIIGINHDLHGQALTCPVVEKKKLESKGAAAGGMFSSTSAEAPAIMSSPEPS